MLWRPLRYLTTSHSTMFWWSYIYIRHILRLSILGFWPPRMPYLTTPNQSTVLATLMFIPLYSGDLFVCLTTGSITLQIEYFLLWCKPRSSGLVRPLQTKRARSLFIWKTFLRYSWHEMSSNFIFLYIHIYYSCQNFEM